MRLEAIHPVAYSNRGSKALLLSQVNSEPESDLENPNSGEGDIADSPEESPESSDPNKALVEIPKTTKDLVVFGSLLVSAYYSGEASSMYSNEYPEDPESEGDDEIDEHSDWYDEDSSEIENDYSNFYSDVAEKTYSDEHANEHSDRYSENHANEASTTYANDHTDDTIAEEGDLDEHSDWYDDMDSDGYDEDYVRDSEEEED